MNVQHRALAEYLEDRLGSMLKYQIETELEEKLEMKLESKLERKLEIKLNAKLDEKLGPISEQLNNINRALYSLIDHVDRKNDEQDDAFSSHELRISTLESDYRVLTS